MSTSTSTPAQATPTQPATAQAANAAQTRQPITAELRSWIIEQAEAGCRPVDVIEAMRASGWQQDVAMEAMEHTLQEHLQKLASQSLPVAPAAASTAQDVNAQLSAEAHAVPEPALDRGAAVIDVCGHPVRVLMSLREPRLVVFGGLLSDDECAGLMALAESRLERSEIVDNQTGGSEVNVARTSAGMFFQRCEAPLLERIEKRIAGLLRWPLENGEGMQVLRYKPGEEYRPHHDYFDPAQPGSVRILERGGQRVATLVIYLNTPAAGGATTFPDVGLEVSPVRGNAVYFSYDKAHPGTRTLHGGAPVVEGEKWVATKWLRQRVFT